eukprot:jgi/Mesen1/4078/ME000213S03105
MATKFLRQVAAAEATAAVAGAAAAGGGGAGAKAGGHRQKPGASSRLPPPGTSWGGPATRRQQPPWVPAPPHARRFPRLFFTLQERRETEQNNVICDGVVGKDRWTFEAPTPAQQTLPPATPLGSQDSGCRLQASGKTRCWVGQGKGLALPSTPAGSDTWNPVAGLPRLVRSLGRHESRL